MAAVIAANETATRVAAQQLLTSPHTLFFPHTHTHTHTHTPGVVGSHEGKKGGMCGEKTKGEGGGVQDNGRGGGEKVDGKGVG